MYGTRHGGDIIFDTFGTIWVWHVSCLASAKVLDEIRIGCILYDRLSGRLFTVSCSCYFSAASGIEFFFRLLQSDVKVKIQAWSECSTWKSEVQLMGQLACMYEVSQYKNNYTSINGPRKLPQESWVYGNLQRTNVHILSAILIKWKPF